MTNRPWANPTEIPLNKLPSRRTTPGIYDVWIADVTRRLERTAKSAIAYPFVTEEEAIKHMKVGIACLRKRHGSGYVSAQRSGSTVYVHRGPKWHMPTDKSDTLEE
jgi:hypothetical protein